MRPCSICIHSQVEDINQDLINGVPIRKVAEIYGLGKSSLHRHQGHILTGQGEEVKTYRDNKEKDNGTSSNVTEYQGNHWKVREEGEKVILYFKNRVIPLIPIGDHYQDKKSKEEFKREGGQWFLGIPYFGWVNLNNVFCFYE